MLPEKYRGGKVVPPDVYNQAAWGLAAGDVNGDGAVDLLVGGLGRQAVAAGQRNLERSAPQAEVSTTHDLRKQIQTRIVTVKPAGGKGLLGCRLTLLDEQGQAGDASLDRHEHRRGLLRPRPDDPGHTRTGNYTLHLRRSDGTEQKKPLTINEQTPRHQVLRVRVDIRMAGRSMATSVASAHGIDSPGIRIGMNR